MNFSENENNLNSNQNLDKSNTYYDSLISSNPNESMIKRNLINQKFGKQFNIESDKNMMNISEFIDHKESSKKIESKEINEDNLKVNNIENENWKVNLNEKQNEGHEFIENKINEEIKENKELENIELEKKESENKEPENIESEKKEVQNIESENIEIKNKEIQNMETENKEIQNKELEKKETENIETENIESENIELEEKELEKKELENKEIENKETENIESENIELENIESKNIELENKEIENIELENIESKNIELENKEIENKEQNVLEFNKNKNLENIDLNPKRKFDVGSYNQLISNIGNCCNDEFFLPPNYDYETKTPYPLKLNDEIKNKIHLFINGESHGLIVNNEGKLFTYGNNDTGCLGRNTDDNKISEKLPNLVDLYYERRKNLRINMISAGNCHSLVGDSIKGRLFFSGNFRDGDGFIMENINEFKEVEFDIKNKLKYIGSGSNFCIIKLRDSLYSFGCNNFGQLGIGLNKNNDIKRPIDNEIVLKKNYISILNGKKILKIFPIYCGCFVITKKKKDKKNKKDKNDLNDLFCWGNNSSCQLGFESKKMNNEEFAPICEDKPLKLNEMINLPFEIKSIIDIKGGMSHTIFLLDSGLIYGIGLNEHGQLGLKEKEIKILTKIPISTKIKEIHCNRYSTYVIDEKGDLYSFGFGSYYVLGTNEENDINIPYKIPKEFFLDNKLPRTLSMGCNHISFVSGEKFTSLIKNSKKTKSKKEDKNKYKSKKEDKNKDKSKKDDKSKNKTKSKKKGKSKSKKIFKKKLNK